MTELCEVLAQAMRRARVGNVEPWHRLTEACRADWIASAEHLLRIAEQYGLNIQITAGEVDLKVNQPVEIEIDDKRAIRQRNDGAWEIVADAVQRDGAEIVFTLSDVHANADRVLSGDPSARKIKGLGTQLAAALEIYRVDAQGGTD